MVVQMDEKRIETIEAIAVFLSGTTDTPLVLHGNCIWCISLVLLI